MRRLCYQVAVSLDGYIAGPNGEFDWIVQDPEVDLGAMWARFDTLIMGRLTFELMQSMGETSTPGKRTVVVSRTLRPEDHPGITVISSDLETAVRRLKAEPGTDIWLFGGGSLFRSLLDLGLVDTVEPAVIPVMIGGGVPFLPPGGARTRLRLTDRRVYEKSGIVLLAYDVERGETSS